MCDGVRAAVGWGPERPSGGRWAPAEVPLWRIRAVETCLSAHLGLLRPLGCSASEYARESLSVAIIEAAERGVLTAEETGV